MQTQTIERTDTDERVDDGTGSDTPKYFHYVKKDKIAESAVMGTHVVALCGEVFLVTRSAAGVAGVPGLQADLRPAQEELTRAAPRSRAHSTSVPVSSLLPIPVRAFSQRRGSCVWWPAPATLPGWRR